MEFKNTIGHPGRLLFGLALLSLLFATPVKSEGIFNDDINHSTMNVKTDTATFAAGCFWCVEEQFKQLDGVIAVISGYTGGTVPNPTYEQVCTGITGHAEACNIVYNPSKISYDELLAAFFVAHDPTQLNRQGNDIGTQYRSAIFYHDESQKRLAEFYIKRLNDEHVYDRKIVTQVAPYGEFYKAEDYHHNYYENHMNAPYCQRVIKPKLEKFRAVFKDNLKHDRP